MLQKVIWDLHIFFMTAFITASNNGNIEIVKLILEQNKIDINARDIYLFCTMFVFLGFCFKIIFGIRQFFSGLHSCALVNMVTMML